MTVTVLRVPVSSLLVIIIVTISEGVVSIRGSVSVHITANQETKPLQGTETGATYKSYSRNSAELRCHKSSCGGHNIKKPFVLVLQPRAVRVSCELLHSVVILVSGSYTVHSRHRHI